ncbi:hypothetical protein IKF63_00690 [Candidatus Saccharibacteria bacterium]|nr:hypothetical protein [Candidatus Saccharibacteria bacterium]
MNKDTANPQNDNEQTNSQNEPINNKTNQATQEESLKTADNFKKETTDNIKNVKRKKVWIIIAIVASILAASGVGIVLAHNNGLIGNADEGCMCGAVPEGVKQCKHCRPDFDYKPIIYLYPEEKTDISVKLGYPELVTVDYPSYNNGWNVTAYPNGNLEIDNRNYYALYYESQNKISFEKTDTGFIVESDKVAEFLEEKLAILDLNERESEEFIVY